MVLIIVALISLIVALFRGGSFANIFNGEIRASFLFIISLLLFIAVKVGNTAGVGIIVDYTYYILLVGYCVLLLACIINLNNIPMGLLLIGTLMNFVVVFLNNGKMPVAPEVISIVNMTESFIEQSATMKIADSGTYLPFLGGIIPIPLPSIFAEIISPGTVVLGCGLAGVIQNALIEYEYYDDDEDEEEDESPEDYSLYTKEENEESAPLDKKAQRKAEKERKKAEKLANKNKKAADEDADDDEDEPEEETGDDDEDIFSGKKNYAEDKVDTDDFDFVSLEDAAEIDLDKLMSVDGFAAAFGGEETAPAVEDSSVKEGSELIDNLGFSFSSLNELDNQKPNNDITVEPVPTLNDFSLNDSVIPEKASEEPVELSLPELDEAEETEEPDLSEPVSQIDANGDFYENTQAFFDELGDGDPMFADLSEIPELSFDDNKETVNYEKFFEREDSDITEQPKIVEPETEAFGEELTVELTDDGEDDEPVPVVAVEEPEELFDAEVNNVEPDSFETPELETVVFGSDFIEPEAASESEPIIELTEEQVSVPEPEQPEAFAVEEIIHTEAPEPELSEAEPEEIEEISVVDETFEQIDIAEEEELLPLASEEASQPEPISTYAEPIFAEDVAPSELSFVVAPEEEIIPEVATLEPAEPEVIVPEIIVPPEPEVIEPEPVEQTALPVAPVIVQPIEIPSAPEEKAPLVEAIPSEPAQEVVSPVPPQPVAESVQLQEQPLVEVVDTDSPFIVKDGKFVENPNYKFRKTTSAKGSESSENNNGTFVLKTRNPSISGRPSFIPASKPSDYRDNKEKSDDDFEKVDIKIGDVQIPFHKKKSE